MIKSWILGLGLGITFIICERLHLSMWRATLGVMIGLFVAEYLLTHKKEKWWVYVLGLTLPPLVASWVP